MKKILGRLVGRAGVLSLTLAMLVVGAVGWSLALFTGGGPLAGAGSPVNSAVIDDTATTKLQSQVARALTAVFSYDYSDPSSMSAAADQVLTGTAKTEHATLFKALQQRASDQKLLLSAQVSAAAVTELTGKHARLLVFVDQSSQRASDKAASVSAAQLVVVATKVDGRWLISSLKPL